MVVRVDEAVEQTEPIHDSMSSTELQLNIQIHNCLFITKITKTLCYKNLALYSIYKYIRIKVNKVQSL